MDKKLKYTIILGYLFLIVFIILLNVHSGSVKILGYEAFKLGNKTVMLKELSGTRLLSESDSIKKYIDIDETINFAIIDDSADSPITKVFVDYLLMENITKFDQVVNLMSQDTTAIIVEHKIISDTLFIKQRINSDDSDQPIFLLSRFNKCFPYFLRVRSMWTLNQETPKKVNDIFKAIKVTK